MWRPKNRIEAVAAEISGKPREIGSSPKKRYAINDDEPHREQLQADPRFAFLAHDRGVHLLHFFVLAIIRSLMCARGWIRRKWIVHFFGGFCAPPAAGAAPPAGTGAPPMLS